MPSSPRSSPRHKKAKMMSMKSFIEYEETSDFPIQNIPFGIFSTTANPKPRAGTAIGDFAVDLAVLAENGLFDKHVENASEMFNCGELNSFMAAGRPVWRAARS